MIQDFSVQLEALNRWVDQLNPYLWSVVVMVISLIIGLVIRYLFFRSLRAYNHRQPSVLIASILNHLGSRTWLFFPLLVFLLFQPLVTLPDHWDTVLYRVVEVMLFIVIGWILLKSINVLEDLAYVHYLEEQKDPFRERKIKTQLQFVRRILGVVIFVLVLASILLSIPEVRQAGRAILASAGIAGVILGFAAQKTLGNLLAGLQIAVTQPIKIDDAVIVENEWGVIEEITLTYVVVKIWDQRRIVLPITYFVENPFQNWTRSSSNLTGVVLLYVDYSLPVEALRQALEQILEEEPLWNQEKKDVQVTDTTDKTMTVRVLVSAGDAADTFALRCSVREKLIAFLQENYPESLPKNRVSFGEDWPTELLRNGTKISKEF